MSKATAGGSGRRRRACACRGRRRRAGCAACRAARSRRGGRRRLEAHDAVVAGVDDVEVVAPGGEAAAGGRVVAAAGTEAELAEAVPGPPICPSARRTRRSGRSGSCRRRRPDGLSPATATAPRRQLAGLRAGRADVAQPGAVGGEDLDDVRALVADVDRAVRPDGDGLGKRRTPLPRWPTGSGRCTGRRPPRPGQSAWAAGAATATRAAASSRARGGGASTSSNTVEWGSGDLQHGYRGVERTGADYADRRVRDRRPARRAAARVGEGLVARPGDPAESPSAATSSTSCGPTASSSRSRPAASPRWARSWTRCSTPTACESSIQWRPSAGSCASTTRARCWRRGGRRCAACAGRL